MSYLALLHSAVIPAISLADAANNARLAEERVERVRAEPESSANLAELARAYEESSNAYREHSEAIRVFTELTLEQNRILSELAIVAGGEVSLWATNASKALGDVVQNRNVDGFYQVLRKLEEVMHIDYSA